MRRSPSVRRRDLAVVPLILLVLFFTQIARAEDAPPPLSPTDVAMLAKEVLDSHCAGLTKNQTASKASALGAIGPVYSQVSAVYEATQIPWLLYWRGVLGQCLGQNVPAEIDLFTFVKQSDGDSTWISLVKDAERRLRVLKRTGTTAPVSPRRIAGVVVGGGLAALAVVSGLSIAVEAVAQEQTRGELYSLDKSGGQREQLVTLGQAQARRQSVFTGLTIGAGVGSVLAFVLAALPAKKNTGAVLHLTSGPTLAGVGLEARF